jgi:protein TonB
MGIFCLQPGQRVAAKEMENVMHAGGYLDRNVSSTSPRRLAIVIALHGAAITALMLAPPEYVPKPTWLPTSMINIDERVPPPPEVIPEPAKPQPREESVTKVPPLVNAGTTDPGPQLTQRPADNRTPTEPLLPLIPTPVTVEASFVKGVEMQPEYPISLARQSIEGVVTVRVLIGADGRVKAVEQVSATDPDFFKATERHAKRSWRFKPATRDGVPIESWRQLTVRFKMDA